MRKTNLQTSERSTKEDDTAQYKHIKASMHTFLEIYKNYDLQQRNNVSNFKTVKAK